MSGETYPFSRRPESVPPVETRYRRIRTALPPPELSWVLAESEATEPRSMALDQLPVIWDRAEGFQVHDTEGNCWLDFSSGIFVANAGHAHPSVVQAIQDQLSRPLLHNYYFPSEIRARLTRKLVEVSDPDLDCVFLLTTGSEATECAIKLARIHGYKRDPKKLGIVTLTYGFHGKTLGSQTAGGRPEAKWWIGQLDSNFHHLPVPFCVRCPWGKDGYDACGQACFESGMQQLADSGVDLSTICAFMFEPYQGWSAAFLPADYVAAMRRWADDHGALLISDEVQAGFGRTGKLFGYQHFGVPVDLVCCGKGLSSSLPISAVLGRRELVDVDPSLNSTHGGNPLCCAAALANLEALQREQLVAKAADMGSVVQPRLQRLQERYPERIAAVSGAGAVWGILLQKPGSQTWDVEMGDHITEQCMRRGVLLVRTGVGSIKLGPPLTMPVPALVEGLDVLAQVFEDCLDG